MKHFAILLIRSSNYQHYHELLKEMLPRCKPLICTYFDLAEEDIPHCKLELGKEIENIKNAIGKKGKVKLIINRLDSHIKIASELVDYFKVPGPTSQAIAYFRDKTKLHELMQANNLSFYRPTSIISNIDTIEKELKTVQYPVVIKPYMGAHSRAVIKVNSLEEFEKNKQIFLDHFQQEASIINKKNPESNKLLIEEYIDGRFIVPASYINGKGKVVNLSFLKIVRANEIGLDNMQLIYRSTPSEYKDSIQKKIHFVLQRLARLTGLKSTFIDPELMIKNGRIYLIEVNPRMGGFRYETMKHAFGIDIEKMSLELALGKEVEDDLQEVNSCTACEIWEEKSGIVKKIKFPKSKFLVEKQINIQPGETYIAPPEGNRALGKFFVKTENISSLKIAKKIRKKIEIVIE